MIGRRKNERHRYFHSVVVTEQQLVNIPKNIMHQMMSIIKTTANNFFGRSSSREEGNYRSVHAHAMCRHAFDPQKGTRRRTLAAPTPATPWPRRTELPSLPLFASLCVAVCLRKKEEERARGGRREGFRLDANSFKLVPGRA